jgi:hypothetical protein
MVLIVLALRSALASGAEPEREEKVALLVSACPAPFEVSLRQILAIELGNLLDGARPAEAPERESIEIACEAETARVSARSAGGDQVAHNDLRFDAFPGDAAPRAVALAAVEALRAVDPTLTERLEAQRDKERTDASPAPAASVTEAKPHTLPAVNAPAPTPAATPAFTRVMLGGVARVFLAEPTTTMFGARLELSRRFGPPWDTGLELEATFGHRRVSLGTVEATLASTAAWFGARAGGHAWSATAALGGRIGLASLRGAPGGEAQGHQATRAIAGPLLVIRGDGLVGGLALALILESGFAAAGAVGTAGGETAMALDGVWLSASANAGLRF